MEEKLINKLVEVVHQRNFIVDCLEMDRWILSSDWLIINNTNLWLVDRRRELDEDSALEDHLSNYAAVAPEEEKQPELAIMKMLKRKKKKKKNKEDEKDVDTSELKGQETEKEKKKSAKKKLLNMTTKKLNSLNLTTKKQ